MVRFIAFALLLVPPGGTGRQFLRIGATGLRTRRTILGIQRVRDPCPCVVGIGISRTPRSLADVLFVLVVIVTLDTLMGVIHECVNESFRYLE